MRKNLNARGFFVHEKQIQYFSGQVGQFLNI